MGGQRRGGTFTSTAVECISRVPSAVLLCLVARFISTLLVQYPRFLILGREIYEGVAVSEGMADADELKIRLT